VTFFRRFMFVLTIPLLAVSILDFVEKQFPPHSRTTDQPPKESIFASWPSSKNFDSRGKEWDVTQLGVLLYPARSNWIWPNSRGLGVEVQLIAQGVTELVGDEVPTLEQAPPRLTLTVPASARNFTLMSPDETTATLRPRAGDESGTEVVVIAGDADLEEVGAREITLGASGYRLTRIQGDKVLLEALYNVRFDFPGALATNDGLAKGTSSIHWKPRGTPKHYLRLVENSVQVVACKCGLTGSNPQPFAKFNGEPSWRAAYDKEQFFEVSNDSWVNTVTDFSSTAVWPAFLGWLVSWVLIARGRKSEAQEPGSPEPQRPSDEAGDSEHGRSMTTDAGSATNPPVGVDLHGITSTPIPWTLPTPVSPLGSRSVQATESLISNVAAEFGLLNAAQVGELLGSSSKVPSSLAHRRHRAGDLLAIRRENRKMFPGFQFAPDGSPIPTIHALRDLTTKHGWSESDLFVWLVTSARSLNGARPVDIMTSSEGAESVVLAAESEVLEQR
jgi:hypothetical protein